MSRFGCFADGQLVGSMCATREEAEEIARDVAGDFPDMEVVVDVVTFKWLRCSACGSVTGHDRLNEGEWMCECGAVRTTDEEGALR